MGFAVVVHATCKCTSWVTLLLVVGLQVSPEQGQFMSVLVKAAGVKMPNMLAQDSVHVYAVFSQATCCGLHKLHPHAGTACCVYVQVSPEQGQFMSVLVKLLGVKHAIEVRQRQ